MDLDTVEGLVTELVSTYSTGLEWYTKWQRQQWQGNRYSTHIKGKTSGSGNCGLSTSLGSGQRIWEAYANGAEILGDGFVTGDEKTRGDLYENLSILEERVLILNAAVLSGARALAIYEIIRVSEEVRASCLIALAEQYQRVAVGRLVPRFLPGSERQSRVLESTTTAATTTTISTPGSRRGSRATEASPPKERISPRERLSRLVVPVTEDYTVGLTDGEETPTASRPGGSSKSPYQSEPPSPPPTPKIIPDDLQSTYSTTSGLGPRPSASVFSLFCHEAVKYQVDLRKEMPEQQCRCGYDWNGMHTRDKDLLILKDGFQMTTRYLGKSHRHGGFGCVLCTSTGRTNTYRDVGLLKDHINSTHTKWQMLHDRDLTGQ